MLSLEPTPRESSSGVAERVAVSSRHYSGLPRVPSVTARVACSGIQPGSVRILVDVLSWRREFKTAGETE